MDFLAPRTRRRAALCTPTVTLLCRPLKTDHWIVRRPLRLPPPSTGPSPWIGGARGKPGFPEISSHITLRARSRDNVPKDLADDVPHPCGALVAAGCLDLAQDDQDLLNIDLVGRSRSDDRISHVEQPAYLVERPSRSHFRSHSSAIALKVESASTRARISESFLSAIGSRPSAISLRAASRFSRASIPFTGVRFS